MSNIETVQSIYAAFGKGDLPTILATLSPDIAWEYQPTSTDVPWLQPRRGPSEVAGFFEAVMKELDIRKFEPHTLCVGGNRVVALVNFEAVVRRTGRTVVEVDEAHVWAFDGAGKIIRFRHCTDTQAHLAAWTR